ncbi:hypothetical protein RB653_000176 [Dictyostelium firmibasis]|uniref:Suppressor of forked domain-containing protein n=1 Tax=Dictyostelium firmibasis TaxID=79012 RepID=A0AAN7U2B9_9MYCE
MEDENKEVMDTSQQLQQETATSPTSTTDNNGQTASPTPTTTTTAASPTTITTTTTTTASPTTASPETMTASTSPTTTTVVISPIISSIVVEPNVTTPTSISPTTTTTTSTSTSTTASPTTTVAATATTTPTTTMPTATTLGNILSLNMPAVGKRLNVQIETLENRINNDMYDTEAWTLLLNEVQSQPISIARDIYKRFLSVFPTAGRYWKLYVEEEMKEKNYDIVEKIFFENLRSVKNVEFWKSYIAYIKQIKGDKVENRDEIIKAFEFALESIGMDISSTSIWTDYIQFLKDEKATTQFEEGQKMTAIRKLYQRAIENPMHDLDNIYKEYEVYENSINKTLAKALLSDHQGKYQHARNVYRDRKSLLEGILRNMLAKPPRSSDKEEHQVRLWRKLITYERSNPQKFDAVTLRNRVIATYNQCLLCLYHYPDIWYEAATYLADCADLSGCIAMFDRSLIALPKNLFIHFAYADYLESQKKQPQAKEIYEKILQTNPEPLVWIQYMKFSRRTERIEGPRKIFKRAKSSPDCTYHVYVALGLIEYYINQDTRMARDIFEIGLKKFPSEIAFVNFYIEFLTNLNEENNTRVLFEKLLTWPSLEKSESIWRKFLDFEYRQNQDVSSILKLEKRYQVTVNNNTDKSGVLQALNRYKFLNLWSCHPTEIEIITKNILDDHSDQNSKDDHHHSHHQPHSRHHTTKEGSEKDEADAIGKDGKGAKPHKKGKGKEHKNQPVPQIESKPTYSTIIPTSNWKVKKPDITQMVPYRGEIGKFTQSSVVSIPQQQPSQSGQPLSQQPQQNQINNPQQQQQQGINTNLPPNRNGLPDFIFYFLQNLPSNQQFMGPFVDPDQLVGIIRETPLPIQFLNQQQPQQTQQQPNRTSPTLSNEALVPNKPSNQQQTHKRKQPDDETNLNNTNEQQPTTTTTTTTTNVVSPIITTPNSASIPNSISATPTTTVSPTTTIPSISSPTATSTIPTVSVKSQQSASDIYRKRQANKLSKKS